MHRLPPDYCLIIKKKFKLLFDFLHCIYSYVCLITFFHSKEMIFLRENGCAKITLRGGGENAQGF